jgi:predicted hotdog family 3-hydroxylacyl-ACP dehydratase
MTPHVVEFPPIEELIPHRGAMLWIERLISASDDSVEAAASVPADAWYLDGEGGMPAWLGIELMAQTLSAHVGLKSRLLGKPPKPGVLLGCRAYRASGPAFPPGAALCITARLSYRDESGFAAYDCAIRSACGLAVSATLKVYEPADFDAFLNSATT